MTTRPLLTLIVTALFLILPTGMALSAELRVSNRTPSENEIGYLPAEGDVPAVNPPPIAWLDEPKATSWTLQVARSSDFSSSVYTVRDWPWLMYTHTEALKPGTYFWRYRFATSEGQGSEWSKTRSFTVKNNAVTFPRPSKQYLDSIISGAHPRMFMMPEKLSELRSSATLDNPAFADFIASADKSLSASIMAEPMPWTGGKWDAGEWGEYLRQASAATAHLDRLAFAWLMTGEKKYGDKAKAHLMEYVSWDPKGPSSMRINDEVGMPMLHSISRAYDWLFPLLSADDKKLIYEHMRGRGEETYNRLRAKPYEQFVYNSHFGRMFHFLGEAGLAFYDEIPEAEKWLNYSMTIFYGWYPFWGGENGGWAEGIWYWTSYNERITWWLDLMRESLGIDGTRKPFYANVGDFPLYVAPPGNPVAGFGDFSERLPSLASVGRPMAAYAAYTGNSEWQWFAEQADAPIGQGPFQYLRSRLDWPVAAAPADVPLLKLFPDAGYAVFHTDMADAKSNLHVAMRCSPYGNVSHNHNDQNAIVMAAYGEPLLVNTGTRDFYGSPFCKEYYWATESHNSILFDGQGQSRAKDTTGTFVAHGEQENMAYAVGDATNAYRDFVQRYRRWTIFLPDAGTVLIDEVVTTATTATLLYHGRAPFKLKDFSNSFELEKGDVLLKGKIELLSSLDKITYEQTDEYPVPLGNNKKPLFDEWHLKAHVPLTANADEPQYIVTWLTVTEKQPKSLFTFSSSMSTSMRVDEMLALSHTDKSLTAPIELDINFKSLTVERR